MVVRDAIDVLFRMVEDLRAAGHDPRTVELFFDCPTCHEAFTPDLVETSGVQKRITVRPKKIEA